MPIPTSPADVKLGRRMVRAMIGFMETDEDVKVNGLDRRNRERLARLLARQIAVAKEPTEHSPCCPHCGSSNIREWGKVSTSYIVGTIASNGTVETTDSDDTAWDSYEYDELRCRDCDYQNTDPQAFIAGSDVAKVAARWLAVTE